MSDSATVFAALLTTGPSPAEDGVLEAAAVRADRSEATVEFRQLADPGPLSPVLKEFTGLADRDVRGKPAPSGVLRELLRFCKGAPVVVWDAPLFRAFLEGGGLKARQCLDGLRLARIVRPGASDYSLESIAAGLGLGREPVRRALPRARLLARMWRGLLDELAQLPAAALDVVCRTAEAAGDPLASVLSEAASAGGDLALSSDPDRDLLELFADQRELFRRVQKYDRPEPANDPVPTEAIRKMFTPGGLIGRHMPGYEQRREQTEMVQAVCEALNGPHHLMVEAGPGTGKSMAYLLPAIAWAHTNGDKVVISTNTKNLQEQLYRKDLPFLMSLLPGRFEPALLKGRRNYVCVRRLMHLVRHFERELAEPAEFMTLAPLVVWATQTESGDLAECNGFLLSPAAPSVLRAIVTGPDECAGRACRFRGRCFVNRARALAQLADIIVVNHALLFAELGMDSRVLPPYRCVVFDEAHNLEDVATEALATVVDGFSVYRITNFLYRARRDGTGTGLLATVMYEAGKGAGTFPASAREGLEKGVGDCMRAVDDVVQAARQFFEVLAGPYYALPPYVDRILLCECQPDLGSGSEAWDAAERLGKTLRSLGENVEEVAQALDGAGGRMEAAAELARDLRAQMALLREVSESIRFVLAQEEDSYVYWLERQARERGAFYSLHAAPLRIGDLMRELLLEEKRCVIFTSATLQVDGRFDYMFERLGADSLAAGSIRSVAVGSPFDYDRQALVGVSTFLPDPGGRRDRTFDDELSSFLIELLQCTQGRALVLFTSYSLLDAVYATVKEPLQRAGITVLAQGHSGSREALTSLFRTVTSSVLLGTRSFWEGVDISGESLSCLVLTKLPFHVFTDPLVRGRTEYLRKLGRDPFVHYTLPEAVVSFRQGFGRLIRTRTDTGVIIVTDRRLVTKGYGRSFLHSLPTRHQVFRTRQDALEAVRTFFRGT
ncbi:MAG: hypothetical protein KAX44_05330 [Candidatus Brocadiae bacterium]|nr:hypothetical protein [Candidatus Brocadiia bacterium]